MDYASAVTASLASTQMEILTESMRQQVQQLADIQQLLAETTASLSSPQPSADANLGTLINIMA